MRVSGIVLVTCCIILAVVTSVQYLIGGATNTVSQFITEAAWFHPFIPMSMGALCAHWLLPGKNKPSVFGIAFTVICLVGSIGLMIKFLLGGAAVGIDPVLPFFIGGVLMYFSGGMMKHGNPK